MFTIEKTKEEITRTTEHEQSIACEKWPWMSQALNWMNTKIAILTPKNKKNLTEIQSNIYIYVAIRYLAKINTWNLVKKKLVKKETHRFNFKFVNHWIIIFFHLLEKHGLDNYLFTRTSSDVIKENVFNNISLLVAFFQ